MPRIRTIKPTFFTSLTIADLPVAVRLTFIGLWTHVDDEGRCVDDARLVKAALWPLDDDVPATEVEQHLRVLTESSLIARYEVDGRRYIAVRGWSEHQRINRPSPSTIPGPEDATERPAPPPNESSPNTHGVVTEDSPPEGKGREQGTGKGESTRSRGSRRAPETPLPDDWRPNDTHTEIAKSEGVDLDREQAKFRDHAQANDRRQRDWDAAFRAWLRRASEFGSSKARASPEQRPRREPEFGSPEWEARQRELEQRAAALTGQEATWP